MFGNRMQPHCVLWATLGLCLLSLSMPSTPQAYVLQRTSSKAFIHWPDTLFPVPWTINMNGYKGVTQQDAQKAFEDAMKQWDGLACTKLRTIFKGTSTATQNRTNRVNVLMFGIPPGASSTATAKTYLWFDPKTGALRDADIVFSTKWEWSVNPTSNQFDLRATATHEIGHMFGLGHSDDAKATMYATTTRGPNDRRNIADDDKQGVCKLYPKQAVTPCSKDSDCKSGETCDAGKCLQKPPATNRGLGALCGSSAGGKGCDKGLLCVRLKPDPAYCYAPCTNSQCPNGGKCLKTNTGEEFCWCEDDSECKNGQTCKNLNCISPGCQSKADCKSGEICEGGACKPDPSFCKGDDDCNPNHTCKGGKCVAEEVTLPEPPQDTGSPDAAQPDAKSTEDTPTPQDTPVTPDTKSAKDHTATSDAAQGDQEPTPTCGCSLQGKDSFPAALLALLLFGFVVRRPRRHKTPS